MEHGEYRRMVTGADTAVLFIHGILGTPRHFDFLIPLVPREYSVINLLLPGHGGTVRGFSHSSMASWEEQVRLAVGELAASHSRIFVAAHSMGTLLALEQALREPRIRGLFLLAVPLRLRVRPRLAVNCAKVFFGRTHGEDPIARAAGECYGIAPDRNLLHYLGWIPRYLELFRKIRDTRDLLPRLKTPGAVFLSAWDEMVSPGTLRELTRAKTLCPRVLPDSTHYYYAPRDRVQLEDGFRQFLS